MLSVYVNIINESILKSRQKTSNNLESVLYNKNEAQMDPIAWPRNTMLPNSPYALLSIPNCSLITIEQAGSTPLSKLVKRLAKN